MTRLCVLENLINVRQTFLSVVVQTGMSALHFHKLSICEHPMVEFYSK